MEKIKKPLSFILAVLFIAMLAFFVKEYVLVSDKDRISRILKLAENCIEKKDHTGFMGQISSKYIDEYGHTWATLYFLSKNILGSYDDINVSLSQVTIEISGEEKEKKATVRFLAEINAKSLSGDNFADMGRFSVEMKKEGTAWKVTWFGGNDYSFY